jgi:CheY-like chemotaxis protein
MPSPEELSFRPCTFHVVIVSDHHETSDMYATYLRSKGLEVATATYEDAAAQAREFPPDVLAADLGLPFEAAFSVCRQFKEHPRTRRIPIVALTGYASERIHADAASAGCGSVLVKPVAPEQFLKAICDALGVTTPSG